MSAARKSRFGFTLVELLVVIAIIGMLVALLLPAVQAARAAARRSTCTNNLRQLALALLNSHNTHGEFPLGAYSALNEGPAEEDGLSWATKILPYLEQQPLYDQIMNNRVPGFAGNPWQPGIFRAAHDAGLRPVAGGETVLSLFLCPSADLPSHVPSGNYFGLSSGDLWGTGYGTTHYKASRGFCDRGMFWPAREGLHDYDCWDDYDGDGTLDKITKDKYTRVRIQDVPDGTSKTIALGEAAYFAGHNHFPTWMGTWGDDGSVMFHAVDEVNCSLGATTFPLSEAEVDRLYQGPEQDGCAFSWHPRGAFFAFVDGSVQFLTENLELRTFRLLGDRMDGEVIPEFREF